jgi:hypothetical protein
MTYINFREIILMEEKHLRFVYAELPWQFNERGLTWMM